MEGEEDWQTVKSSSQKPAKKLSDVVEPARVIKNDNVPAKRSATDKVPPSHTILKRDGRDLEQSKKGAIPAADMNSKKQLSSAPSSAAGGRKLGQSTKKQGLALFDVLLSSKPSGAKAVVVSKAGVNNGGGIQMKNDSFSSSELQSLTSQSMWPSLKTIEGKEKVSPSLTVTAPSTAFSIEKAPISQVQSVSKTNNNNASVKTPATHTAAHTAAPAPTTTSTTPSLKTTTNNHILTRHASKPTSTVSSSTMALEPKRFVYRKKRVKKPSKLKKRILLERLRQLIIQQLKEQQVQEFEDLKSSNVETVQDRTIYIFHFLDDYDDVVSIEEEEKEELIANIRELLSPCGVIFSVEILSHQVPAAAALTEDEGMEHLVAVTFVKPGAARSAVGVLNGMVIAGQKLVVQLKSTIANKASKQQDAVLADKEKGSTIPAVKKGKNSKNAAKNEQKETTNPSVLILSNVITEDEVQDEDEVAEVLNDMYHLASSSSALKQGIESIWIEESSLPKKKSQFCKHVMSQLPTMQPLTMLQVQSFAHACNIMEALHGKVIAGQMLETGLIWKGAGDVLQWVMKEELSKLKYVGIVVADMLDEETLQDEDEVGEVLSNVQDLLQQHAPQTVADLVTKKLICDEKDVMIVFDLTEQSDNFFELFADITAAMDALKRVVIAGQSLSVKLVATSSPVFMQNDRIEYTAMQALEVMEALTFDDNACIGVMQYLTTEDLEDIIESSEANNEVHEQIMTLKSDLLTLLEQSEPVEVVSSIRSMDFLHRYFLDSNANEENEDNGNKVYDVAILFSSTATAQQAMVYFDHLLLGGSVLESMIRQWDINADQAKIQERRVTEEDSDIASKLPLSIATTKYDQLDINHYSSVHKVEYPMDANAMQNVAPNTIQLPKEKKYFVAKQAPKLRRHGHHDVLFESSIPIADEEINLVTKEFLRLISTFQLRLKEKLPPTKVKQKLRYVTGMKQALTSIKASKAKLLIIAPNTEQSDELDAMLSNVIYEASRKEIPTLYALNKRLLGKSLQMSMKQSVVAIFDPDGAYELYKKIVRYATTNAKPLPPSPISSSSTSNA